MRDPSMRLRCPKDTDPTREAFHLAMDARLPMDIATLGALVRKFPKCPCGAELVIRTDPKGA